MGSSRRQTAYWTFHSVRNNTASSLIGQEFVATNALDAGLDGAVALLVCSHKPMGSVMRLSSGLPGRPTG